MKTNIIKNIQLQFKKLTNSRISEKEIINYILPLIDHIINNKKNKILISGSQGIGKTTLLKLITLILKKYYKKNILSLSLDDFYFDKKTRLELSTNIHPLLKTRGVPGTHDIKYIESIINNFDKSKYPIKLPNFDKLTDDRKKKFTYIKSKSDILILEGWCVGCPSVNKKYLFNNLNYLEKKYDNNFIWRKYYNHQLKTTYFKLFKKFNSIVYLKAPSFNYVCNWRINQEKHLKRFKKNSSLGMSNKEIRIFIQFYEKITKWMVKKMPEKSDIVLYFNKKQKIYKLKK